MSSCRATNANPTALSHTIAVDARTQQRLMRLAYKAGGEDVRERMAAIVREAVEEWVQREEAVETWAAADRLRATLQCGCAPAVGVYCDAHLRPPARVAEGTAPGRWDACLGSDECPCSECAAGREGR